MEPELGSRTGPYHFQIFYNHPHLKIGHHNIATILLGDFNGKDIYLLVLSCDQRTHTTYLHSKGPWYIHLSSYLRTYSHHNHYLHILTQALDPLPFSTLKLIWCVSSFSVLSKMLFITSSHLVPRVSLEILPIAFCLISSLKSIYATDSDGKISFHVIFMIKLHVIDKLK